MKIYSLAGITKLGKQAVKQHGDRWESVAMQRQVLFSDKTGPWLLLVPINEKRISETVRDAREETASRWVHAFMDENFKVMP